MFIEEKKKFKKYLSTGEGRVPIAILSGYSGSGKSTFINWLKLELTEKNYFFKILNVNDTPKHNSFDSKLLIATIESDLQAQLLNQCKSLDFILKHIDKFSIFLDTLFLPLKKEIIDIQIANEKGENTTVFSEIEECRYTLIDEGSSLTIKVNAIKRLTSKLNFRHLLLIYILEYLLDFEEKDEKESYIFCFDNIDQLRYEYLSLNFWNDFYSVWKVLQTISKDEDTFKLKFDFDNKFKFLIVLRESNLSLTYSMNPQLNKNLSFTIKKRRCILSGEIKDILTKRINYIENHIIDYDKDSALISLLNLLDNYNYRDFVRGCLFPLFNYDYRHFFTTMDSITDDDNSEDIPVLSKETLSMIKSFGTESVSSNLSKGAILLPIITSSCKNQFLKLVPNKANGCRIPRLLLTVLYNLTYPRGLSEIGKFEEKKEPVRVSLSDLYKPFCHRYTIHEFLESLKKLCYFNEDSWAHLVSFYNVSYNSDHQIEFSSHVNDKLKQYESGISNEDDFDFEKDIYMHFNAASYSYLRYIITHFEYFSFLVFHQSKDSILQPIIRLAFTINYNEQKESWFYDVEDRIDQVADLVKFYKSQIDSDFTKGKFKDFNERSYVKSEFCFGDQLSRKEFYITRVITTHIRYIDDFRKFIFFSKKFEEYYLSKKHLKIKSREELNQALIDKIINYLDILDSGVVDPTIISTSKRLRQISLAEKKRNPTIKTWQNIEIGKEF